MKIETSKVTMLRITDVPRLDPIRVTLDNGELGKGRITIECYSKAWSSYWGAMADRSVEQFFVDCDNGYLISNLAQGLDSSKFCGYQLEKDVTSKVLNMRRSRRITNEEARDLYGRAIDLHYCNSLNEWFAHDTDLLITVYDSNEWWYPAGEAAAIPNPEYTHLERICDAVREALIHHIAKQEPPTAH